MSLSLTTIYKRVAAQVLDVQRINSSVLRFTRKAGETPFAVCYLDVSQDLPKTESALAQYQDRVIGKDYFKGRKSLQWSTYLYFITDAARFQHKDTIDAKELIERDRNYARKFVIPLRDLDDVLRPPVVEAAASTPSAGIISVWTRVLVEAGLEKAIFEDMDLPARLRIIESPPKPKSSTEGAKRRRIATRSAEPFIRSLQLKKFRQWPLERQFEFGTANLICGVNGSGKTSLLEAIELFYCGRNKRNPESKSKYELVAELADRHTEIASSDRALDLFRERNLVWYGQAEVKTNKLYASFARFNFLDTDAAVNLAQSADDLEDDLSRLLVGPDAAKIWRDIVRVHEEVETRLREVHPRETQANEALRGLEKQLKSASRAKQESDSIRIRLQEMTGRLRWKDVKSDKAAMADRLVESLSELIAVARQAVGLKWVESPVSTRAMTAYCRRATSTIGRALPVIARLEQLQRSQQRLTAAIKSNREALDLVKNAKHVIDAGIPDRARERGRLQSAIAEYADQLAGADESSLARLLTSGRSMTVVGRQRTASRARSEAAIALATAKRDYAKFTRLRDQSISLAQELREIAAKLIQTHTKPDECPLCHTQFGRGELAKHIGGGLDREFESRGQELLATLRKCEGAVQTAIIVEAAAAWLKKFCEKTGLSGETLVATAMASVDAAKSALAKATNRVEVLERELGKLEARGMSQERLDELSARLRELGYPLGSFSRQTVERLLNTISGDVSESLQRLEVGGKELAQLQKSLEGTVGTGASPLQDPKRAISQLKEKLVATERLLAKMGDFSSQFPWPDTRPCTELVIEAESISEVAGKFQSAIVKEAQAKATYTEAAKQKALLAKRLSELRSRMKRLSNANAILKDLRTNHSLNEAMKTALQENRAAIETIFLRIHSPAEFHGLGSGWTTLVRNGNGREAGLSEISTGQRSAYALSVFLAQNAQLTVAPPVLLIDDPIAHIDDLNSLSFLDYLREIVLGGRRQVFFATASDKLAALIARKFDFLGREFRRFDLRRPAVPSSANG